MTCPLVRNEHRHLSRRLCARSLAHIVALSRSLGRKRGAIYAPMRLTLPSPPFDGLPSVAQPVRLTDWLVRITGQTHTDCRPITQQALGAIDRPNRASNLRLVQVDSVWGRRRSSLAWRHYCQGDVLTHSVGHCLGYIVCYYY